MATQYDPTKIWSTLLTNRGYFGGALVLNHTLRKTGSKYQLKIMVTREVEADTEFMEAFAAAGIPTIVVDKIEPAPRDGKVNKGTWEKLAPWSMTEYEVDSLLPRLFNEANKVDSASFSWTVTKSFSTTSMI
jgi:hypothetical protein